ncbi:hypothetical protein ACJVQT_23205 [Enterobacter huaxiensis]|uniref:hypothetical protein n=1 Tax=Enterobacter huaxiensis TaxID=2494702 RepID=UPI002175EE8A|nr:hypothetical protein [Enterobacter huaxiensis]MCS5452487.1 hypothetical protein [Enterobacter huaxiensis]
MAYGIEITNQAGKVYANPSTPFMHMTKKVVANFTGVKLGNIAEDYNTGILSSAKFVPYAKLNKPVGFMTQLVAVGGYWHLKVWHAGDVSVTFYFFTDTIPTSTAKWGIEFYNADGTRIYSTSTLPLQNHQANLDYAAGKVPSIDIKQPVAAIPQACDYWIRPIGGGRDVMFMTGTPAAVGNVLTMGAIEGAIMPSETGFSFRGFGGLTNYIYSSLYD